MLKKSILAFAVVLLIVTGSVEEDCNMTHYEFFSNYSLGKQDELNKTFDQIEPTLSIPDSSFAYSDIITYNLSGIKTRLSYRDSSQKSSVAGRDTIFIFGGYLVAEIDFTWVKITSLMHTTGTASATIRTDEIMFEKLLVLDSGYLDFDLVHAYQLAFKDSNFSISRIDPPAANETQQLTAVLNKPGTENMKTVIASQLNSNFTSFLKKNLKSEHFHLDDHFDYEWNGTTTKAMINYSLLPTGVTLNSEGLSMSFVARIKDDSEWECGRAIPSKQLNPRYHSLQIRVYGGLQEFISFSIISNTVRYSFERGYFDSKLSRQAWESRFFQFFAGDLYEVIPEIGRKFYASQEISGSCKFNPDHKVKVTHASSASFNVTTDHTCQLSIGDEKISQFTILLESQVEIHARETALDFRVKESDVDVYFSDVDRYRVENQGLGKLMIEHSLRRMKEGNVFGSGWKIYPRDYPHATVYEDYVVIFDSTHVA